MKDGIHPDYHPVVFHDIGADYKFLTRSTITSKQTIQWEDGNEYPLVTVDISSASHPFYTGKMKYVDSPVVSRSSRRSTAGARRRNPESLATRPGPSQVGPGYGPAPFYPRKPPR